MIADILRQARSTVGLTLRDVERETGISNAYISQLESGQVKQPSPQQLHKLAAVYQLDYGDLLETAGYVLPVRKIETRQTRRSMFLRGEEDLTPEEREKVEEYIARLRAARQANGTKRSQKLQDGSSEPTPPSP
jgi:transcriptional regulator with XRE-family HTH domain